MNPAFAFEREPARPFDLEVFGEGWLGDVDITAPEGVEHMGCLEDLGGCEQAPCGWWSLIVWLKPGADAQAIEAELRRQTDLRPKPGEFQRLPVRW